MRPLVLFETMFELYFDGWCAASRAYARAMELAGVDVRLKSWRDKPDEVVHPAVLAQVGHMMRPCERQWDAYVWSGGFYGPFEGAATLLTKVRKLREQFKKPVAFYTMFERTNVQPELVPLLNALDSVMVPCSANQRALERAGVTNARFIGIPFFSDDPHLALPAPRNPPRVFYWIGRWEPRKAPHRLVWAFLHAFEPGEAELVLKLGPAPWVQSPYIEPEQAIQRAQEARAATWSIADAKAAIRVVREKLEPEAMVALHSDGDVYCSASHGEGIDMPAFAAKLAGRRVVTTACGGPEDFVDGGDFVVPARGEIAIPAYDRIWGAGSTGVDYDVADLIAALRAAKRASSPPERSTIGAHYAEIVAPQLGRWVEDLVR